MKKFCLASFACLFLIFAVAKKINPGVRANFNGQKLETLVAGVLEEQGYRLVAKQSFFNEAKKNKEKLYTRQWPLCDSIYSTKENSHKILVDFLLFSPQRGFVVGECKSQTTEGSVDEKYPYLVENIKEKYPYPAFIMLDVPAAKPGAKIWLKNQVEKNPKLLEICGTFSEFRTWAMKNL